MRGFQPITLTLASAKGAAEFLTDVFGYTLLERGLQPTPQIDRDYFHSAYFRGPCGVLFEIVTENPGFPVDEPLMELGTHLMLPKQHEPHHTQLEASLPPIN